MKLVVYCRESTKKVEVAENIQLDALHLSLKTTFPQLSATKFRLKYWDRDVDDFLDLDGDMDDDVLYDKCKLQVHICEQNQEENAEDPLLHTPGKPRASTSSTGPESPSSWRQTSWPVTYKVPRGMFSLRLTDHLKKEKEMDSKTRNELINVIGDDIYKIKPYPLGSQLQQAARAIVEEYPHLKETLGSGYDGWRVSLTNKLKKLRQDMKESEEVKLNKATKRGKENKLIGPGKAAKRPKKGEVNWAPDVPEGEDEASITRHKDFMSNEMEKPSHCQNKMKIRGSMDATYASRRKLLNTNPSLKDVKDEYPALFKTEEILSEYSRLMPAHNLNATMTLRLLTLGIPIIAHMEKLKSAKKCKKFQSLLEEMNRITQDQDERKRRLSHATLAATFLPLLFNEARELVKLVQEHGEEVMQTLAEDTVDPVLIVAGDMFETELVCVAAEGEILFHCTEVTEGLVCLFALYYVCNIQYPGQCKKTCSFIQHALMNVTGGPLPVCVVNTMEKFKHALPKE